MAQLCESIIHDSESRATSPHLLAERGPHQLAHWMDNYGNKVDELPTLNFDPEMLQYGAYISEWNLARCR